MRLGRIVNVASVAKRSPFRYPGGKTWLVPYIRVWLSARDSRPSEFIEPFAGGAIVGLTVAVEGLAEHVTLAELDPYVAAVWQTIFDDDGGGVWLADRILNFNLTHRTVERLLQVEPSTVRERAFQTIVRNRVNRGGILAPGAGMLKYGENGNGILSRWYPETLSKRIQDLLAIRDRITFIGGDGIKVLRAYRRRRNVAMFIDPPYTAAGKRAGQRLYTYFELDHEGLFDIAQSLQGDFLMTYENTSELVTLARQHGFQTKFVPMRNMHQVKMNELLIGKNLGWLRSHGSTRTWP